MEGVPIQFSFEGSRVDSQEALSKLVSKETNDSLSNRILLEVSYLEMSGDETLPMSMMDRFLLNRPEYNDNNQAQKEHKEEIEQPPLPASVAEKFLLRSDYPGEDILAMY
jgi:hypothetical protein